MFVTEEQGFNSETVEAETEKGKRWRQKAVWVDFEELFFFAALLFFLLWFAILSAR